MSKRQKLLEKLRRKPIPRDFTWDELVTLLGHYQYVLKNSTGSSHCKFLGHDNHIIMTSKPHPNNTLKGGHIKQALEAIDRYELLYMTPIEDDTNV
ncbi:MAG: type II toxin-antitoxin system HicA family toxin [Acinetobacter junii]|uniref:type II toxin-antitoxin system HicA family toxin n=1 Tax=Acinetobacter TaxID=469 RepID=UPI00094923DE|nr:MULTISPECIES: type II toxin-antitoxin system HicA family toxin [Acinetobacter]APR70725.1 hypothetical protein AHTJS_10305 [Acinetobacter haemolyticus]QNH52300.1 type II toxin-antitoxin system HicA family toxin [Acinetobacter venetianus]